MFKTNKKEEFSRAYVCAIASQLGFNSGDFRVDDDSVDILFKAIYSKTSKIRNPQIHFQLKCTNTPFGKDGYLHYSLIMKNYNDLRGDNRANPCYLIVLCVPEDENNWIEIKPEEMILRYSAYWLSLKDEPDVKNSKNVTVRIPKHQKLDKESFQMLMNKASEGIAL